MFRGCVSSGLALVVIAGQCVALGDCPTTTGLNALPDDYPCEPNLGYPDETVISGTQGRWKLLSLNPDWQIQRINASALDFIATSGGAGSETTTNCQGVTGTPSPEYDANTSNSSAGAISTVDLGENDQGCGGIGGYAEIGLASLTSSQVQIDSCAWNYSRNPVYNDCLNDACSVCIVTGGYAVIAVSNVQFAIVDTSSRALGSSGEFNIDSTFDMSAAGLPELVGTRVSSVTVRLFRLDAQGNRTSTIFTETATTVQDDSAGSGSVNLSVVPVTGGEDYFQVSINENVFLEEGDYELAFSTLLTDGLYGDVDANGLVNDDDVSELALLIGQAQPMPNGYAQFNFDGSNVNANIVTQSDVDALFDLVGVITSSQQIADVNGDGVVDCADASTFALFNSGITIGDVGYLVELDVNRDGTLDATDELVVNSVYYPSVPGDVNRDGDVNLQDLNFVLANFGSGIPAWSNGDLNGSGSIDLGDMNLVLTNNGTVCP